jgi:hypothetical protein
MVIPHPGFQARALHQRFPVEVTDLVSMESQQKSWKWVRNVLVH